MFDGRGVQIRFRTGRGSGILSLRPSARDARPPEVFGSATVYTVNYRRCIHWMRFACEACYGTYDMPRMSDRATYVRSRSLLANNSVRGTIAHLVGPLYADHTAVGMNRGIILCKRDRP